MVQKKGKRTLVTALSILTVLLLVIGIIALVRALGSNKHDPYKTDTSSTTSSSSDTSSDTNASKDTGADTPPSGGDTTNADTPPDPSTVSTIDVAPMGITVSYVKGIGRFEYEVLRAQNGTRYVEFRSADLIGTKCTNDMGTFASIIANPTDDENTALAKTTTVDGTKYGLSLADATCTSDTVKLQKFQQSFTSAFGLLKKTN